MLIRFFALFLILAVSPAYGQVIQSITVDVCKKMGCHNTECVSQLTPDPLVPQQCPWKEEYICANAFGNCGADKNGECNWLPNPDYDACSADMQKTQSREHLHNIRRKHYEQK